MLDHVKKVQLRMELTNWLKPSTDLCPATRANRVLQQLRQLNGDGAEMFHDLMMHLHQVVSAEEFWYSEAWWTTWLGDSYNCDSIRQLTMSIDSWINVYCQKYDECQSEEEGKVVSAELWGSLQGDPKIAALSFARMVYFSPMALLLRYTEVEDVMDIEAIKAQFPEEVRLAGFLAHLDISIDHRRMYLEQMLKDIPDRGHVIGIILAHIEDEHYDEDEEDVF